MIQSVLASATSKPLSFRETNPLHILLSGKSARTIKAYRGDLSDLARFLGCEPVDVPARLMSLGHGHANATAYAYRAHMLESGLSPATVNRRLAAVRSLSRAAKVVGVVDWELTVDGVKGASYRDTKGPGRAGVAKVMAAASAGNGLKGLRDAAMVRLMFDCALRRGEVVELNVSSVDLGSGTVSILGKGRREREILTLPPQTRAALARWIGAMEAEPSEPLFISLDNASSGHRLTGSAVYKIVRTLGASCGVPAVRPHGLRHAAITEALELTHGNVRNVQRFSRHKDIRTLSTYDDNRTDLGGNVAAMVALSLAV